MVAHAHVVECYIYLTDDAHNVQFQKSEKFKNSFQYSRKERGMMLENIFVLFEKIRK